MTQLAGERPATTVPGAGAPVPGVGAPATAVIGPRAVRVDADRPDAATAATMAAAAPSVARLFLDRVQASGDAEAFRYPGGAGWTSVSWRDTGHRVCRVAAGLVDAGIRPGDRVGLVCNTRFEWLLADLGLLCAGAAAVAIFPTTTAVDIAFELADSGARIVVVEDVGQLRKLTDQRAELPEIFAVILIDAEGATAEDLADGWVRSLDSLEDAGGARLAREPGLVETIVAGLGPDDLAALAYTSGTTGTPKGVRLVNECWTSQAAAIAARELLTPDDLQFLWLPLSHAFGTVLLAAQLAVGFPTAVDGRVERLVENLAVIRPTFVGAAPRVFEKAHDKVVQALSGSRARRAILEAAVSTGRQVSRIRHAGGEPGRLLAARYAVADRLVFSKLRERFGGRIRFFISGSAKLDADLAEWFDGAGIHVLEGYGLTETSGAITVNMPWRTEFGSVGAVFPGSELRLAADGEVFVRGPGVMRGYHNRPTDTAAVLDPDGWFATGDIGEVHDGFLTVTDRKKDLIKSSNGKYVAPQKVENLLTSSCPYLAAAHLVGNNRSYCVALLALDPEAIAEWAPTAGLAGATYAQIAASPRARKLVADYVDAANAKLSSWETIKKFDLLPEPPEAGGELMTATMKIRRRALEERYADRIAALYA